MKKLLAILLAAALLLSLTPALAAGADIQASLPSDIAAYFAQSKFNGNVIGPDSFVELTAKDGQRLAYAIAYNGNTHTVYGFRYESGGWVYKMRNDSVLPHTSGNSAISYYDNVLSVKLYNPTDNSLPISVDFTYQSKDFLVTHVTSASTKTFADISSDHVTYYNNRGERVGRVSGTVARSLGYFNFSRFPKTYSAAMEKLSVAPDIPYNSELTAQNIKFQNGKKYPVYTGPSTAYFRAANGKAVVSTNDWIQVFGSENGYILVQYALNSSQMRFGYIDAASLPRNASVPPLNLEYSDAVILQNVNMTDDPLNSQAMLRTLSANQRVKWLAVMGSWVYVEVQDGTPVRGFVPAMTVARASAAREYTDDYTDAFYSAVAVVRIENGMMYATVTVTGNPNTAGDTLVGYQLYANNQAVASTGAAQPGAQVFTLSAPYLADTIVLGLCPIFTSGERVDEAIVIPLSEG